jgi:CRISPR-associated protein Csx10
LRTGGVRATGSYLDTLSYLPGSILRGTLAEWLSRNGKTEEIITTVRRFRFGNLFPSHSERVYALPFPPPRWNAKHKGGFGASLERKGKGEDMEFGMLYLLLWHTAN